MTIRFKKVMAPNQAQERVSSAVAGLLEEDEAYQKEEDYVARRIREAEVEAEAWRDFEQYHIVDD